MTGAVLSLSGASALTTVPPRVPAVDHAYPAAAPHHDRTGPARERTDRTPYLHRYLTFLAARVTAWPDRGFPSEEPQQPVGGRGVVGYRDLVTEPGRPVVGGHEQHRQVEQFRGQGRRGRPGPAAGAGHVPAVYGHLDRPGAGHDPGGERVTADHDRLLAYDAGPRADQLAGPVAQHGDRILVRVENPRVEADRALVDRLVQGGHRVVQVRQQVAQIPVGTRRGPRQRVRGDGPQAAEGVIDRALEQPDPPGEGCGGAFVAHRHSRVVGRSVR